jgi:hypothetical protein
MTTDKPSLVKTIVDTDSLLLTKSQKTFQKLIKDIDTKRQILADWEAVSVLHQQKLQTQFMPLWEKCNAKREALLLAMDQAHGYKGLSKTAKKRLEELICLVAEKHLSGESNDTVKELYARYNGVDYDTEQQEEFEEMKEAMAAFMGIPLDDSVGDSPEDWMRHMQDRMAAEEAARESAKQSRKKSAKTLAKEAKEKEAESQVSQSIREVYRQLAKALHPDKEQDLAERERKTILMQQVNDAYQKKSLLTLLELQLSVEQIDASALVQLSEERLGHYNKILKNQYRELLQEIADVELSFKQRFNVGFERKLSPKQVMPNLQREIRSITDEIEELAHGLRMLANVEGTKAWVRYA